MCAAGGSLTSNLRLCKPLYQTPDWHTWVNGNMDLLDSIFDATTGLLKPEYSGLPVAETTGQVPYATDATGNYGVAGLYVAETSTTTWLGLNQAPTTQQLEVDLTTGPYDSRFVKIEGTAGGAPLYLGQTLDEFGIPKSGEWALSVGALPELPNADLVSAGTPAWMLQLKPDAFEIQRTPFLSNVFGTVLRAELLGAAGVWTNDPQSGWHVPDGYYLQAEQNGAGSPPAGDCSADKLGRVYFDTDEQELCFCAGADGWRCVSMEEVESETTWNPVDGALVVTNTVSVPGLGSRWWEWTCNASLSTITTGTAVLIARPRATDQVTVTFYDPAGFAVSAAEGTLTIRCNR